MIWKERNWRGIVATFYNLPMGSKYLLTSFNKILNEENKETIILGHLNVNYLDINTGKEFKSLLTTYGFC